MIPLPGGARGGLMRAQGAGLRAKSGERRAQGAGLRAEGEELKQDDSPPWRGQGWVIPPGGRRKKVTGRQNDITN
jgi:hypothetical protein